MSVVDCRTESRIATVTLQRGKVNALNHDLVRQLGACIAELESNAGVSAIVITGAGKFFSFGFDIPEFLRFSKEAFTAYLRDFTSVYTHLFACPKPVVAAINGHAIAGGCMLALACDQRLMAAGRAKMSLNEITFGSSVFAGSVEMLRYWVGSARAQEVLVTGAMYDAEQAHRLGLVDEVVPENGLAEAIHQAALRLANTDAPALASIKRLLRAPVIEKMRAWEAASIREFVDIWYSEATWERLQEITIRA